MRISDWSSDVCSSDLLADQLFNTIDWEKCQSSLNGFPARLDSDGRFRAVIAAEDPGVPNWLDTAGRFKGVVQGRWYQASAAPTPTLKRVALSDLRDHLPSDTRRIDRAARRENLRARFRGAQFRPKWWRSEEHTSQLQVTNATLVCRHML